MDLDEMVVEGHRLLARDAKSYVDYLLRLSAGRLSPWDKTDLTGLRRSLSKLGESGNARALGEREIDGMARGYHVAVKFIPDSYVANTGEEMLTFASSSVRTIFPVKSADEFMARLGAHSVEFHEDDPLIVDGIFRMKLTEYVFNDLLMNIHEMIHFMDGPLPSFDDDLKDVPGMDSLEYALAPEEFFAHERKEAANPYRFFVQPHVLYLAERNNVDLGSLRSLLNKAIPAYDFALAVSEGRAYVKSIEALSKEPLLRDNVFARTVYQLMATLDAIMSPLAPERGEYNRVGVGLVRYDESHAALSLSRPNIFLPREVSDAFFGGVPQVRAPVVNYRQ